MYKWLVIFSLFAIVLTIVSFTSVDEEKNLRKIYSRPSKEWPQAFLDSGITPDELASLPQAPKQAAALAELGKNLFFDPRLSSSGKIACVTCHQPQLSWTDGKARSAGH